MPHGRCLSIGYQLTRTQLDEQTMQKWFPGLFASSWTRRLATVKRVRRPFLGFQFDFAIAVADLALETRTVEDMDVGFIDDDEVVRL